MHASSSWPQCGGGPRRAYVSGPRVVAIRRSLRLMLLGFRTEQRVDPHGDSSAANPTACPAGPPLQQSPQAQDKSARPRRRPSAFHVCQQFEKPKYRSGTRTFSFQRRQRFRSTPKAPWWSLHCRLAPAAAWVLAASAGAWRLSQPADVGAPRSVAVQRPRH